MKSLLIIKPKQSNKFYISARRLPTLFLGLIAVLFLVVTGVFASKDAYAQNTTVSTAETYNTSNFGVPPAVAPNTNSTLTITSSGSITNIGAYESATGTQGTGNTGTTINNSGIITAFYGVFTSGNQTAINNVTASSQINAVSAAIYSGSGTIDTITNAGVMSTTYINGGVIGIGNGTVSNLTNTGTITASGNSAHGIKIGFFGGVISNLTNTGTITASGASSYGIENQRRLFTLNNAQGAGNSSGALTYTGNLPQNYNIILGSNASTYGKLAVTSATSWDGGTGTTSFGINGGIVKAAKYTAVISGVTASLLTTSSLAGTYSSGGKSYAYSLALETGSSDTWDLLFPTYTPYPWVANTNQSLVNTASVLQGTYTLQNSLLANSFSYDCTVFGANNVCVSAGGRNTAVAATNGLSNTSALLIAAYRLNQNYRIGAYADQNLSASNPGGTVNLGNNTPLIGLFAAWNERLDGTGTEVKVSAAYGQKNTTINRSVVGSGDGASEAGTGSSNLTSQGVQATVKYGFGIMDNIIVSPYVGVRYTQNNMGGYTESTSSSVTAPLTYSALNTNATTALAGVGASYRAIPTVTTFASAGVETDTNTANGTYSATNTSIGALTPVNFNANPVRTRPTATLGAYYDIEKNQRIGITGIYRQEAYQAVSTTTVMATYTVGL